MQEEQAVAIAWRKYLKTITFKNDTLWEDVLRLIELKQSQSYEQAIAIFKDWRDLAESQDNLSVFQQRIQQLQSKYSNRQD